MKIFLGVIVAALLCLPVRGSYIPNTEDLQQLPQLELVPGIMPENTELSQGLQGLYNSAKAIVRDNVRAPVQLGIRMLAVCLLLSLIGSFAKSSGLQLPERAADLAGVFAVTLIALGEGDGIMRECVTAIKDLVQFGNILFPVYAGAVAVAGHPVSAAAQAGVTMLAANLIMRFASGLFVPAVQGYILLHAAAALSENGFLRQCAGLIRSSAVIVIRILLMGFTAYLTLSGIISGGADATAVKAARLAVTSTVPVVGAIVADASDALLSGASLMKNSIGLFGCFAACAVCLTPFIRAFLHFSIFRVLAALADPFAGSKCGAMLRACGDGFGFSLGLLGTCCALQFLSFVVSTVVMP